ncbi:MAG: hypothetical protein GXO76_09840 [Calditrichaeota bacterium]|nr:hypothetical protein [Calditrichota bacterium]
MKSYTDGLTKVIQNKKYWLLFYAFNLMFALISAYPAHTLISRYLNHSLRAEDILRSFDFMAIVNFFRDNASGLSVLVASLFIVSLVYGVLYYFLMGGVYSVYGQKDAPTPFSDFWNLCSDYFLRFFRIFLLGALLLLILLPVYFLFMSVLRFLKPHIFNEIISSLLRGGALFLIGALFLFFNMLLDYTKTFLVLDNHRSVLFSFAEAVRFVFRHPGSTLFLYGVLCLTGLFLMGVYWVGSHFLTGGNLVSIGALFLFQQFIIFLKVGLRLQFFASQIVLVNRIRSPFSYL